LRGDVAVRREARGQKRSRRLRDRAHGATRLVTECTEPWAPRPNEPESRRDDDSEDRLRATKKTDADRKERMAVDEVRRAVERIHVPREPTRRSTLLFRNDSDARSPLGEPRSDECLALEV